MNRAILISAATLLVGIVGASFAAPPTVSAPGSIANTGTGNQLAATHQINVSIPAVVMLRITGGNNVSFDVTPADLTKAANTGSAIVNPASSSTLSQVRGWTNGSANAGVAVSIAPTDSTNCSTTPTSNECVIMNELQLNATTGVASSAVAIGSWTGSILGTDPSNTGTNSAPQWTVLAKQSDYTLALGGSELPTPSAGYTYLVTFTATVP